MSDKTRTQNQDEWKRTQIRIPQDQYDDIVAYAEGKEISINTAMIELIDNGLRASESRVDPEDLDIKIIKLENGMKRLVYGKLLKAFDLDYTQDLNSLKVDIELSLKRLYESSLLKRLSFFNKKVFVYQGNNHLDIVDDGIGSLNWLIVEDHVTDEYMENLHKKNDQ
ncbi:hypothetical protein [Acinetobacter sp. NIPH 2699]|uniref:hypothetical protein n=1 Tax=Acinetobacter sp. NIPH 2699 TaxID=2923433 RepID=UPI001F4A3E17|nr:hypothetical protein [Acinetobacter sp. NIPH 2699]MCH7337152.1 hypothetical protein [Acinetobacter sp. NIPH 2699]